MCLLLIHAAKVKQKVNPLSKAAWLPPTHTAFRLVTLFSTNSLLIEDYRGYTAFHCHLISTPDPLENHFPELPSFSGCRWFSLLSLLYEKLYNEVRKWLNPWHGTYITPNFWFKIIHGIRSGRDFTMVLYFQYMSRPRTGRGRGLGLQMWVWTSFSTMPQGVWIETPQC